MDKPCKLRRLNDFRRSLPHVTASALAAILNAVRQHGLPKGDLSRKAFRAARDFQNKDLHTKFGPVLRSIEVKQHTSDLQTIPIANPFALVVVAVEHCPEFSRFLYALLVEKPSSPDDPWHIMLYSDEVTPGNPLATMNNRKFHAIYWTFIEFGENALSHEEGWFTCCTEFSTTVNKVRAGLSQVFAAIIKVFMDPHGHNFETTGMLLNFPNGKCIRLWAVIGGFLQDGAAHKSVWHCRGDGASCPCLKCLNYFTEESRLVDEDGSNMLVCSVLKFKDLKPASSRDVRNKARYLEAKAGTICHQKISHTSSKHWA